MFVNIVVGDPHLTPAELTDCEALLDLVEETSDSHPGAAITFLGDAHNNHDVVTTRCIEFWRRRLTRLGARTKVFMMRGNHDQVTPAEPFPHALLAYIDIPGVRVISEAQQIAPGVVAAPYYYDPAVFIKETEAVRQNCLTLYCHQTFDGSEFDSGFYAKDAVAPAQVNYRYVISGHIHKPQSFGKVMYPGAPRWRTMSDANTDRAILVITHDDSGVPIKIEKVSTGKACSRIWKFDDRAGSADKALLEISRDRKPTDRVHVSVFGPSPEYVRTREFELKAAHNVRTRGFPDKTARLKVSESEGIGPAFSRFTSGWVPPNGTSLTDLRSIVEARLGSI